MTRRKLKYRPSVHAIERMREYFGTKEIHAVDYANELMQGAQFVRTQPDGKHVFKSVKQDVMLVIGANHAVVTVLPPPGRGKNNANTTPESPIITQPNVFTDAIKATIARELRKAQTLFKRSYRQHTLKLADVNLEIAELFRNKVRCKHPGTQDIIQQQIDVLQAESERLNDAIETQEREFRAIEEEASLYLRGTSLC